MCEYCEGISSPISFPTKITYENGETQTIQDGFRINIKERKLETFQKDLDTKEEIVVFSRDISYCPFCGMDLDEMEYIMSRRELNKNKTPKDIVIDYCEHVKTHDISFLEDSINNLSVLTNNADFQNLAGCPHSFGLGDFKGLCWETQTKKMGYKEQEEMCKKCWKKALNVD